MNPNVSPSHTNRLIHEKSPYLRQHAHNPVDWFPWGAEALNKAKTENKVIFLSIGYSTCHWCHVMERESFENEEIANLLNQDFVSIKVDREERPDLDQVYMQAVQIMTNSGGWPLTAFLTPDLKPFAGGTYFPPEDRWGRIGMKNLLPRVIELWKTRAEELKASGNQIADWLKNKNVPNEKSVSDDLLSQKAFDQFQARFDSVFGGFGESPKFPSSQNLSFLLRYWKNTKNNQSLKIVTKTLDEMARGGIFDHLAGGFHRYSTDQQWLTPHFEKMLYDQGMLVLTYVDAFQVTHVPFYEEIVRRTIDYVLREMTSPEGGFYAAEDADSEGEEGKFYVWQQEEIKKLLGKNEADFFNRFYGVTREGNFEHGTSILHESVERKVWCEKEKISEKDLPERLENLRDKLLASRGLRIRPLRDEKILTAWNALMISALAKAGWVLDEKRYTAAALKAANFIETHLVQNGRLMRRHVRGETALKGYLDDYAFWIAALLDLYETTFDIQWLEKATIWSEKTLSLFKDVAGGGFFYSGSDGEALIARMKDVADGPIPSSNAIMAMNFFRLGQFLDQGKFKREGMEIIQASQSDAGRQPTAFSATLMALDFSKATIDLVISGDLNHEWEPFKKVLRDVFSPSKISLHRPLRDPELRHLTSFVPWMENQKPQGDKLTIYFCQNRVCQKPIQDSEELRTQLQGL